MRFPPYVTKKRAKALVISGIDLWTTVYHLGEFMRSMSLVYLVSQFEAMLLKFIQCSLQESHKH